MVTAYSMVKLLLSLISGVFYLLLQHSNKEDHTY